MAAAKNFEPDDWVIIFFMIIFLLFPPTVRAGTDCDAVLGVSAGYDDNVSLSAEEKGSAYISYHAKLGFRFLSDHHPTWNSDMFAEGIYQEYLNFGSIETNHRLRIGGYSAWAIAGGRLMPGMFGSGTIYRDASNPFDEKDGIMVGAKLDWLASARLTLRIQYARNWQFYKSRYAYSGMPISVSRDGALVAYGSVPKSLSPNFVLADAGIPMPAFFLSDDQRNVPSSAFSLAGLGSSIPSTQPPMLLASTGSSVSVTQPPSVAGGRDPMSPAGPDKGSDVIMSGASGYSVPDMDIGRNESVNSFGIRCVMYFFSYLQGEISAEYIRSDFSVSSESHTGKTAAFSLTWMPGPKWEITPSAYSKRFDYEDALGGFRRRITEQGIGLNISRLFRSSEVFFRIDLSDYDSDFAIETYRRTVTQCGMVWSF